MRRLFPALALTILIPAISSAAWRPKMPIPRPPAANGEMLQVAKAGKLFDFNGVQLKHLTPAMASFLSQTRGKAIARKKGSIQVGEFVLEKLGQGSGSLYTATIPVKDSQARVCFRVWKGKLVPVSEELAVAAASKGKRNVFRFDYDGKGNVSRQVEVRASSRRFHVIETPIADQGPLLDHSSVVRVEYKNSTLHLFDPHARQIKRRIDKLPTDPIVRADMLAEISLNLNNFPIRPLKEPVDLDKLGPILQERAPGLLD